MVPSGSWLIMYRAVMWMRYDTQRRSVSKNSVLERTPPFCSDNLDVTTAPQTHAHPTREQCCNELQRLAFACAEVLSGLVGLRDAVPELLCAMTMVRM